MSNPTSRTSRLFRRCVTTAALIAATATGAGLLTTTAADAHPASASTHTAAKSAYVNPLAGRPWGIYKGNADALWSSFEHTHGMNHKMLGRIALHPRTRWYTAQIPATEIAGHIRDDIAQEQNGNPNVEVWMALFRLWPHHESGRAQPLTHNEIQAYHRWMENAARAIGNTRAAVVLEPDMPVSLTGWKPSVRLHLVNWAAHLLGKLPNATVYLDGGSSDWLHDPMDAATMLKKAGIRYVHGFALGITHRPSVPQEVRYGRQVAEDLTHLGIPGKHFVVDTADNGHPYTFAQFYKAHPNGNIENPPACTRAITHGCDSLGIPPTTDVTNPRWGLPKSLNSTLEKRVDAFMWIKRSWLHDNDSTFTIPYAVNVAKSWPYAGK